MADCIEILCLPILFLPEWREKHSECPNFLNESLFKNKWKFQGLNILEFW